MREEVDKITLFYNGHIAFQTIEPFLLENNWLDHGCEPPSSPVYFLPLSEHLFKLDGCDSTDWGAIDTIKIKLEFKQKVKDLTLSVFGETIKLSELKADGTGIRWCYEEPVELEKGIPKEPEKAEL